MNKVLKELSHEAWPGFKRVFAIVLALLTIYLLIILLSSPDGGAGGLHH